VRDLQGRLEVIEPMAVLQMLHNVRATGRLNLSAQRNRADVFFERGNISFASVDARPSRIGELLVEQGAIERSTLQRFLDEKRPRKKLGARLVESGAVAAELIEHAVETQIREVIYEVVRWREGRFRFRSGERPVGEDILNQAPLAHLMLEGARRMDEAH
jgi:hypothetical protein